MNQLNNAQNDFHTNYLKQSILDIIYELQLISVRMTQIKIIIELKESVYCK